MTIRLTAYDTTACRDFVIKPIQMAIEDAMGGMSQEGLILDKTINAYLIVGDAGYLSKVKSFSHPLLINIDKKNDYLVVDVRNSATYDPYGEYDRNGMPVIKVRSPGEFAFAKLRACLNSLWVHTQPTTLRDFSSVPLDVYSGWVSENVTKRYSLDSGEQYKLAQLAALFYLSCFEPGDVEFDKNAELRIVQATSKAAYAKAEDVLNTLDELGDNFPFKDIKHFCDVIPSLVSEVRLKGFNPGILYTLVGNTWFNSNAKELLAVALEHPPTWVAIVASCAGDRSYRASLITKVVERRKRDELGGFAMGLKNLMDYYS